MFTCSQARQARTRPGLATEDLHSSHETVRWIIEELDLRYERIPEEYKGIIIIIIDIRKIKQKYNYDKLNLTIMVSI